MAAYPLLPHRSMSFQHFRSLVFTEYTFYTNTVTTICADSAHGKYAALWKCSIDFEMTEFNEYASTQYLRCMCDNEKIIYTKRKRAQEIK